MVAPQELNDDAGWTLVQSKKTRKERVKARQEHMAAFLPLSCTQDNEESVASLSNKSASSSKCSMKPNLSKIFNINKLSKCALKEVTIKARTDAKQEDKNEAKVDDIISLSSTDSNIMDNMSIISISSTSEESSDTFSLTLSSVSSDDSSKPSVYKSYFSRKKPQDFAFSAQCTENSINKIKKNKIIKQVQEPMEIQDFPLDQQELYMHKLHHNCIKNI